MTTNTTSDPTPATERGSAVARGVFWFAAGALAAILVVADPFGVHPFGALTGTRAADAPAAAASKAPTKDQVWTCSMHPQIIEEHPGQCPICGMDLVPIKPTAEAQPPVSDAATHMDVGKAPAASHVAAQAPSDSRKILFYRNPMDPTITSPVPRKDDMGMDYVPVYADRAAPTADKGTTVTIDPSVQQNMNVVTTDVRRRDVSRQIRTVGYLDYDQERMVTVTTKYPGYIERSYVRYLGQPISKGEPLFEIYSPELVQSQKELLSALRYVDQMKNAPEDARLRARSLVDAVRTRLAYWDVTSAQIERLEESGKPSRDLTVYAPASGLVMKLIDGLEGMAVKPGMDLLHLAGLSPLWLNVEVYEDQLPWVHAGSPASVTLSYFPGEQFTARVRFVGPEVSEETRSVGVTLEVPNPRGRLRTGMYATVLFEPVAAKNAITVPSQAVLRTGERNVVVVALGNGRFAPREVVLGPQGDGFVQVLSGLSEGERIVTSAQFLIDSESNLQQAIAKMIAAKRGTPAESGEGNAE